MNGDSARPFSLSADRLVTLTATAPACGAPPRPYTNTDPRTPKGAVGVIPETSDECSDCSLASVDRALELDAAVPKLIATALKFDLAGLALDAALALDVTLALDATLATFDDTALAAFSDAERVDAAIVRSKSTCDNTTRHSFKLH